MSSLPGSFVLTSPYKPTGDQPKAIASVLDGFRKGKTFQVIMGATGTGKTFTDANIVQAINKPTLVIVHNKTLASQLYGEFKELFPQNRVEYFVSNFDFYQPEAYIPKSDTYIEKNAVMNEDIEMLRTSAVNSILERNDTIVVASVAAIYALSDPEEYRGLVFEMRVGETLDRKRLFSRLVESQFHRDNGDLPPGSFRVRGDVIDIAPMVSRDYFIRISTFGDEIDSIREIDRLNGTVLKSMKTCPIYPAYDHASTKARILRACDSIEAELEERLAYFKSEGKLLEAERLELRTRQDIESLKEFGICPGIENYSRHIDGRKPGQRPRLEACTTATAAGRRLSSSMASVFLRPSTTARSTSRNSRPFSQTTSSAPRRPPAITKSTKPAARWWSRSFVRPAFSTRRSKSGRPSAKSTTFLGKSRTALPKTSAS